MPQPLDEDEDGDRGFGYTLFGENATYEPAKPPPRDFKPWHRPRKQYVRRLQWLEQVRRLLDSLPPTAPLAYLGLPGSDLLDLKYLYDRACAPAQRSLRFLGFNSQATAGGPEELDLHVSLHELRSMPGVSAESDVMPDDIRRLADEKSVAWRTAYQIGPFDVVNLDLCDGVTSEDPRRQPSLYDAIAQIAEYQARRTHPWLLLLTTRITRADAYPGVDDVLMEDLLSAIEECEDLLEVASASIGYDVCEVDRDTCDDDVYLRLIVLAICHWLIRLANVHTPNRVEVKSAHCYRVYGGAGAPDLVSLAVRIEPVMARPQAIPVAPAEPVRDHCAEASAAARRVGRLRDVDADLASDARLLEEVINEMEQLLAPRYEAAGYRRWLAEHPQFGS